MQVHLVDATYELFRAHFAPRPAVLGRGGIVLSGVSGLVEQLLYLLREEGATHVGCATDRVIESFRNDLFAGYKSSAGMPPELLAQFPIAEAAVEASGIVLWPMVEFEADDAIAAAAVRFAEDPRVERILVCTPDKDMAQLVRDERIVLWDRRRASSTTTPASGPSGASPPTSIPDYLAVVGRFVRRLSGLARLGRQVGRRDPGALRLARGDPATGQRLGGARARRHEGDRAGLEPRRALGRGDALSRPGPPADRGRRRPDPPARRRRAALGWHAARPSGRRSARNGAWGAWRRDRTAGWSPSRTLAGGRDRAARRDGPAARPGSRSSVGPWARSNHGPPSIAVTRAPPRSAIRPAAATSQADSPPCWMNASNRPLAT